MSVTLMQHELAPPCTHALTNHHASSSCGVGHSQDAQFGVGGSRIAGGEQSSSSGPVHFPLHSHTLNHDELPQPLPVQILRLTHARSRSASASALGARARRPSPAARERAASTSERASAAHPFLTLPRGMLPRAAPVAPVETPTDEPIGAFSPTSCPRRTLHHLLGTAPPAPSYATTRKRRSTRLKLDVDLAADTPQPAPADPASPTSPIPSICRTPSSYSESEYFPTAPSSAGPATPVHSNTTSPVLYNKALRPILEALEDASKFKVRTACASCGKDGNNFPCCPRCGEMWCSRECRLQSTGGKRHRCKSAPSQ